MDIQLLVDVKRPLSPPDSLLRSFLRSNDLKRPLVHFEAKFAVGRPLGIAARIKGEDKILDPQSNLLGALWQRIIGDKAGVLHPSKNRAFPVIRSLVNQSHAL